MIVVGIDVIIPSKFGYFWLFLVHVGPAWLTKSLDVVHQNKFVNCQTLGGGGWFRGLPTSLWGFFFVPIDLGVGKRSQKESSPKGKRAVNVLPILQSCDTNQHGKMRNPGYSVCFQGGTKIKCVKNRKLDPAFFLKVTPCCPDSILLQTGMGTDNS